jgi:hypothetical protein
MTTSGLGSYAVGANLHVRRPLGVKGKGSRGAVVVADTQACAVRTLMSFPSCSTSQLAASFPLSVPCSVYIVYAFVSFSPRLVMWARRMFWSRLR